MMLRAIAVTLVALNLAPLQCGGGSSDDPSMQREDTAGDALWALAEKQKDEHDDKGRKETLRFLVERYPSSRHAPAAKDELAKMGETVTSPDGG